MTTILSCLHQIKYAYTTKYQIKTCVKYEHDYFPISINFSVCQKYLCQIGPFGGKVLNILVSYVAIEHIEKLSKANKMNDC